MSFREWLPAILAAALALLVMFISPVFTTLYQGLGEDGLPEITRTFLRLNRWSSLFPLLVLAVVWSGQARGGRYRHLAVAAGHALVGAYVLFAVVALSSPMFRLGDSV